MAARKITVEFLGNNRDLDRAMDQSSSRAGRFGSALKKAGKVAAVGLAAGALIAGKALFEMTKAAAADEAAQVKLANTLKNAAGATKEQIAQTEDWITKQGELYGVTDDELRPALAKLVTATGDVGKATKLASLAMNVSAGTGKSMEQVTKALADAENGRLGGLGKLGVATKNAKGETLSLEQIQKRLAKVHEGAAGKAANTLEGKMNRLKVQLSEAGEAIGAKLIPVVSQMVDWFVAKGLPAIQQFGGWMKENLFPIFQDIGGVIRKVFGGMNGDVGGPLAQVKATILEVVGVLKAIWAQFGDYYVSYVKRSFENVLQVFKGVFQVIRGVVKVFSSLFKGDWQGVWEGIKLIVKGALNIVIGVVKQALNVLKLAWKVAWTGIKALVGSVWDGIKTLVSNGAGKVVDAIKAIPGKIKDMAGNFRDAGKHVIGAMIEGLSKAGNFVSDIAGKVWDAVKGMLNAAIDKINAALEFTIDPPGPGPTVNINPANIPHLAKGGLVSRPTLALIGEDGPEAVVPLGKKNAPKGRLGIGGNEVHIHIHAALLDPVGTVRALESAVAKYETSTGRVAFAR